MTGSDGVNIAVYDAATEQEDIAVIGTYATPTALNVRVSPQANSSSDFTQMMFADSVYAGQDWIVIDVTDGQTTIMDFQRFVDLRSNARDSILVSTTIAAYTSNVDFTLTAGSTDDDAYNNRVIVIRDVTTGEQKAVSRVRDYVGSTKQVLLTFDPGVFTFAATDNVVILATEF